MTEKESENNDRWPIISRCSECLHQFYVYGSETKMCPSCKKEKAKSEGEKKDDND